MNIIKMTSTHNTTAAKGRSIKYIAIHYTAGVTSRQGSARNTANWFMNSAAKGSADFIVDDVELVQYNPDPRNRYCWAVGDKKYTNHQGGSLYGVARNFNTISIEICSSSRDGKVHDGNDSRWYFTDAAVDRAVELTKYLMQMYGIDASRVVRHNDISGKHCPGIIGWNADSGDESMWRAFQARIGGASSSSTVTISSDSLLKKGSRGDTVRTMQTMLNEAGYSCGTADGIFGNKTLYALKSFQKDHGLTVDGIYGPKSKAALEAAYQVGTVPISSNLRKGNKGEAVRTMQTILTACGYDCGGSDGIFGNRTLSALKSFQADHGLTVDGIYGPKSRAALTTLYQSI